MTRQSWARQAERGLLGLFVVALVWLPLPLGSNRPWALALFAALVWLLLAAAGLLRIAAPAASSSSRQGEPPARVSWGAHLVLALMVAFTAWCSLQLSPWGYTEDAHETRMYVLRCVGYVGAFWLVQLLVTSDRRRLVLLGGLLGAGVIQAMIAMVLFSAGSRYEMMGFDFVQGMRATGTFTGPDALASYLLTALSAGLGLMLTQMGRSHAPSKGRHQRTRTAMEFMMSTKMLVRILLILLVIALVLTRSRMGNAAFFLSLFLVGGWVMLRSPKLRRPAAILVASLLVIDTIVIGQWVGLSKVIDRMQATEMSLEAEAASAAEQSSSDALMAPRHLVRKEESLIERTRPVRDALQMLHERPWTGFGGGAFYTAFPRYKQESLKLPYNHAHNDYVEIAADTGVPGLALLALVVLLTLGRVIQLIDDRQPSHVRGTAIGVGMGLICALLHATVDLNLQINATAMALTVLLAVVWTVPRGHAAASRRK